MKKNRSRMMIMAILFITLFCLATLTSGQESAQESPGFTLARMVVCEGIENREPVGEMDVFPATVEKIYTFLEAEDITEDTDITIVWYFEDNVVATVALTLRQGPRWRTYSSKNIAGLTGNWKAELQDAHGTVLKAITFIVQ